MKSILVLLMCVVAHTQATCTLSGTTSDCSGQGVYDVPGVPRVIDPVTTILLLNDNNIDTMEQTEFELLDQVVEINLNNNALQSAGLEVFKEMPLVERIYLKGNDIWFINDDAFKSIPELKVLDLSENALTAFKAQFLANVPKLEILDISYNQIASALPGHTFNKVPLLKELYINNNPLGSVNSILFSKLTVLERLWIQGCGLRVIPSETLKMNTELTHLYVSDNLLTALPSDLWADSTVFHPDALQMKVFGNPWNCCEILWLKLDHNADQVSFVQSPQCSEIKADETQLTWDEVDKYNCDLINPPVAK